MASKVGMDSRVAMDSWVGMTRAWVVDSKAMAEDMEVMVGSRVDPKADLEDQGALQEFLEAVSTTSTTTTMVSKVGVVMAAEGTTTLCLPMASTVQAMFQFVVLCSTISSVQASECCSISIIQQDDLLA